jgi:hypothetical protein
MRKEEQETEEQEEHGRHSGNTKQCHLGLLPEDLFRILSEYLLDNGKKKFFEFNDWRNLMNTSKSYFAKLKRESRYITLKNNSNHFLNDPLFRQRVLSLVEDPNLQISC